MLGKTLDYLILSPLAHSRNRKTEAELNERASMAQPLSIENANLRLRKLIDRLDGNLPIDGALRYLDIGCGKGDITIALAAAGCGHVTGIDFVARTIAQARNDASRLRVGDKVEFVCGDIHDWTPEQPFDVVLSHEALEHIHDPQAFLKSIARLVTPDGLVILAFGPLFHSPFGDHMNGFFKVQIPWRGAMFSEQAVLRIRRECFRPTERSESYQEITGGLNQMRYSEFLEYVQSAGWEFKYLCVNPQAKRIPLLHGVSNSLVRIPLVRDYFASSIYAILRRRGANSRLD